MKLMKCIPAFDQSRINPRIVSILNRNEIECIQSEVTLGSHSEFSQWIACPRLVSKQITKIYVYKWIIVFHAWEKNVSLIISTRLTTPNILDRKHEFIHFSIRRGPVDDSGPKLVSKRKKKA